MDVLIVWLLLLVLIGGFAYYKASIQYSLLGSAFILFIYFSFHLFSTFSFIVLSLIWLVIAFMVLCSPLRRRWVTVPLLHWFKAQQPPISESEQQVLAAGGLSWEAEFFTGSPNWKKIIDTKPVHLTKEEQLFIDNQVETLCDQLNDWEITHELKDLPTAVWDYIKREKFWGLVIAKEYGGLGFSAMAHSAIVTKIASRSYTAAINIMVPNSLGPAEFLSHFGTEKQREYYLPRLACGEEIPCFALTAPNAGSDATSIQDEGIICNGQWKGEQVLGIRLNFEKRYITLAPIATLIGLAFKLYDPDNLLSEQTDIGITLALIPADCEGIAIGTRHYPLHMAFMNGPIRGKNVFIPLDYVIGGKDGCGEGWKMMMECLAIGRGISLPALSAAASQMSFRMSGAYAVIRRQFQRSIGKFEGVETVLARIAGFTYLSEATRIFTAQAVTLNKKPAIASAITKYHLTELARKVVLDAMDVHGGRAIQMGPRNYMASLYDGMPTSITVEGANILTRNLIIFGQGALRCHPFLKDEIAIATAPEDAIQQKKFDQLILQHLGFILQQIARSITYGVTGSYFIKSPLADFTATYYKQLTRMSVAFTLLTDSAMLFLGSKLKLKESLSARLGDVLSYLYLATAVLKYYQDQGGEKAEQASVCWSVEYCLFQIGQAIEGFLKNFPVRWAAFLLRRIIFPLGIHYNYPADQLGAKLSEAMQNRTSFRERLTQNCYINREASDITGRMEAALQALWKAAPIYQRIEQAVREGKIERQNTLKETVVFAFDKKLINTPAYEAAMQAEALREQAIQVDEFNSDLKNTGGEEDEC